MSLRRKLVYAFVPLLVFLTAAEVGSRLLAGDTLPEQGSRGEEFREYLIHFAMPQEDADIVLRYDPELFWKLAPHTPDVPIRHRNSLWLQPATNSLGLRDDEVVLPRPAGVTRILCVGDSCTYGSGVVRKSSFPELLAGRLGGAVDVVNAGVPGYSSFQAAAWLQREGWRLEPDIVVLSVGFNDGRSWGDLTDEEHRERLAAGRDSVAELLAASRFLQVLREFWRSRFGREQLDVSAERRTQWRVPEDRYRHWLGSAADEAAARGARILFLLWPTAGNLADPAREALTAHQEALRRFCGERGLPCVNPIAALSPHRESVYLGDDVHMNQKGNAIVAWELAHALRTLGWVPP